MFFLNPQVLGWQLSSADVLDKSYLPLYGLPIEGRVAVIPGGASASQDTLDDAPVEDAESPGVHKYSHESAFNVGVKSPSQLFCDCCCPINGNGACSPILDPIPSSKSPELEQQSKLLALILLIS